MVDYHMPVADDLNFFGYNLARIIRLSLSCHFNIIFQNLFETLKLGQKLSIMHYLNGLFQLSKYICKIEFCYENMAIIAYQPLFVGYNVVTHAIITMLTIHSSIEHAI